jgi:hypothetical protein
MNTAIECRAEPENSIRHESVTPRPWQSKDESAGAGEMRFRRLAEDAQRQVRSSVDIDEPEGFA